jgi:predicted amidophosphoribosyltransferase
MPPPPEFSTLLHRGAAALGRVGASIGGTCAVCATWPGAQGGLCGDCVEQFAQPALRCQTCAIRLPAGLALGGSTESPSNEPQRNETPQWARRCADCQRHPPPLAAAHAVVDYAYPWSGLVRNFKYHQQPAWATALAGLWLRDSSVLQARSAWVEQGFLCCAVAVSAQRLQQRGYNQSLLLARAFGQASGLPRLPLASQGALARLPHAHLDATAPEPSLATTATRGQRLRWMNQAFWVPPEQKSHWQGKNVLLIDDVMTTGATLFAAANALLAAGAAQVHGLVVARTLAPNSDPLSGKA